VETRVGVLVSKDASIRYKEKIKTYVSRGAQKLLGALNFFPEVSLADKICLDFGASTGGFTQVILESNPPPYKIFAIDIGYGLLSQRLRENPLVEVKDRTNAKDINWKDLSIQIPKAIFVSSDLSFISLRILIPVIESLFHDSERQSIQALLLFKPQFEISKDSAQNPDILQKGIIVNQTTAFRELVQFCKFVKSNSSAKIKGIAKSPIKGTEGNTEYFVFLTWGK
jgi:23S rRNA (cytidine1920-2'-O)/16S rRNA (cytidine1409-2'-O)-methyltransferase